MEFSVFAPGGNEIELSNKLPNNFKGHHLFDSTQFTASSKFGEFVFQHYIGDDFDIWYSNYGVKHDALIHGRGDLPLIELHMQFSNEFEIEWDGYGSNMLKPHQYNITYTPFINNKAKFLAGKHYQTFDIIFKKSYLEEMSDSSDALKIFLDKVDTGIACSLSPIDRFLTPEMLNIISLIKKCDFNDRLNRVYIEHKVKELLVHILCQMDKGILIVPYKISNYDQECLHYAKELLLSDFEKPLSLKAIARKSGINEFKLKKGFKQLFGNTVFGYRHSVRMEKARQILLETALPIHDLAFMIGYDHPENFQKAFKKYWGYTPAELRKGK